MFFTLVRSKITGRPEAAAASSVCLLKASHPSSIGFARSFRVWPPRRSAVAASRPPALGPYTSGRSVLLDAEGPPDRPSLEHCLTAPAAAKPAAPTPLTHALADANARTS